MVLIFLLGTTTITALVSFIFPLLGKKIAGEVNEGMSKKFYIVDFFLFRVMALVVERDESGIKSLLKEEEICKSLSTFSSLTRL